MKIIDEKGRLFGKINIIDIIVVVFLLSLLPMVYYGYRIITAEKIIPDQERVTVEVRFIVIVSEIAHAMEPGDFEKSNLCNEEGEIVEIIGRRPINPVILESFMSESKNAKSMSHLPVPLTDVTVKLNLLCTRRSETLYYDNRPLKIGMPFIFSTDLYDASGVIVGIEEE